jgi:hypothetical protein
MSDYAKDEQKEQTPYQKWIGEIDAAEKELEKFHARANRVVRRFLDERDAVNASSRWMNLFYANTKILRASLYAQLPRPEVRRRFTDYNDDIARVAAEILQRCVSPDGDDPSDLFHSTVQHTVFDRLVSGLGSAWLRVETDTTDEVINLAPVADETNGFATQQAPDQQPAQFTIQRITDQRIAIDYVYWEDLLWSPCRIWEERRWTGRKVYMSRAQCVKRFGEEKAKLLAYDFKPRKAISDSVVPQNSAISLACVYEIWDRTERKVIWLSKGVDQLLDERGDFLKLKGFEPCPRPMLANVSTSNTAPRPDFYMVQDQYNQLDELNARLSLLIDACKVVGVYDRAAEGVQAMLTSGFENKLVPVDNWAMFAEKGGLKGQVDWLPLEQIVLAAQKLSEAREGVKAQIYELTGISDIVRGQTKASETLGAQELKAKFASVRIKDLQEEVTLFVSELLRIKAELMVKHFDPEILRKKSNIDRTDDAQMAEPALQLLQSEEGFEWRIIVTSDQLSQTDYAMEKEDRIQLLTAISGFMSQAGPMFQTMPQAAPLLVGIFKWAVAGFRGARDIEGMLDQHLDALTKSPPPPPEEKPDPAQMKAEADIKRIQAQTQGVQQKNQLEAQGAQMRLTVEQVRAQQQLRQDAMKFQQQMQHDAAKARMQRQNG